MKDKIDSDIFSKINSEKNKIFSSLPRFTIMLILITNKKSKIIDLSKTLNFTSGNLDHHLKILEENKMLKKNSQLFQNRFYATVQITKNGMDSFTEYLELLKDVID